MSYENVYDFENSAEPVPCCYYIEFLLYAFEDSLREASNLSRGQCRQTFVERSTREGVFACTTRRIGLHAQLAYQRIAAMEYFMYLIEQCKMTKNWGRCESPVCAYHIYHREPLINPRRFPNVSRLFEFWIGRCRHSIECEGVNL